MATESQTTATKNPYAPNAQKAKFRSTLGEIMRKRKDPEYARHVLTDVMGIDEAIVDQELVRYQAVSAGQPAPPEQALAPELSSPQQQRVDAINTVSSLMKNYRDLYDKYTTDDGLGIQITGEQAAELKTAKSTIEFAIANAVGTGALQAADRAVVQDLLPDPTGILSGLGIAVRGGKKGALASIDTALAQFKASRETIETGKAVPVGPTGAKTPPENGSLKVDTNKEVNLNTPEEAAKWVQQFPDDPRAEEVKKSLERVGFKPSQEMIDSSRQAAIQDLVKQGVSDPVEIKKILDEQSSSQGLGQSDFSLEEIKKLSGQEPENVAQTSQGTGTDFTALGGAIGESIGSFTGGNKIGEAIGNIVGGALAKYGEAGRTFQDNLAKLAEAKASGKITEEKFNKAVAIQEKGAKEAFGYNGPSFREVAGDAVKAAITVLGGAEVKGATFLGTVARAALWGGAYGAADAQSQGKGTADTLKESATTAALSALFPVAGAVGSKLRTTAFGKNTPAEALGEILQGKTKDLTAGQRVFKVLDTKGVETYEQLGQRMDDFISASAQKVDELLGKDTTARTLDALATKGKTLGGKVVSTNYVEKAMQQLQELYTKVGDGVSAANMRELLQKARSQGLTNLEVNQLARKYNIEFGDRAFNKVGDALTSVNSQMYETVRKGLKDVARSGLNGEAAKNLDSLISDAYSVRTLIRKNIEKINSLDQRAAKRGWGEKIGRGLGIVADTATGGILSGFVKKLIPSNVGLKTLNALDLEQALSKNLRILEEATNAETPGALIKAIKKLNRGLINSVKGKGGLSIQDVSKGKAGYSEAVSNTLAETKRGFGTGAGRMKNEMEKISLNVGEVYTKGKKVKESILNELADFTEYAANQARGVKIERIPDEIRARAIAEKLGINPDVSNIKLAERFGKLLEKYKWKR